MKRQHVVTILYLLGGGAGIAVAVYSLIHALSNEDGWALALTAIVAPVAIFCLFKAKRSAVPKGETANDPP